MTIADLFCGTDSTPRIHTPAEFRDLLISIAVSAKSHILRTTSSETRRSLVLCNAWLAVALPDS